MMLQDSNLFFKLFWDDMEKKKKKDKICGTKNIFLLILCLFSIGYSSMWCMISILIIILYEVCNETQKIQPKTLQVTLNSYFKF